MENSLLKTDKQHKLFKSNTKNVSVLKLSDLLKTSREELEGLPEICRMAWESPGRMVCQAAAQELRRITGELTDEPYPFVFCCQIGGKVLVVPTGSTWKEEIYLLPCRSPILHKKHLKKSAQICQKKLSEVEEHWWKLPQFGPKFAERCITSLKRKYDLKIHKRVEQTIHRTAEAYGLYEFDAVIYDTLREISEKKGEHKGIINIKFSARSRTTGIQIVRLVTDTIVETEPQINIPIVGLAVEETYSANPEKGLLSPRVDALYNTLLSNYIKLFPEPHRLPEKEAGKWVAETIIYLKDKLNPQDKWLQDIRKLIRIGLDCGSGTVCEQLLRKLAKLEFPKEIPHFKNELLKHAHRLQESLMPDERERMYVRILADLKEALNSSDLENINNTEKTKHVIEELLKFLEPFSLNVRIQDTREGLNTHDLLLDDLSSGSKNYTTIMAEQFFESNTSRLRQDMLSIFVDFIAVLSTTISLGIVHWDSVVEELRARTYRNFARRQLYIKR